MATIATAADESAARRTTRSMVGSGRSIVRILAYNRAGFVASWVLGAIVVISFVAPLVVPEPLADMTQVYQTPSLQHPLGTDFQGADVMAQVLRGGQTVLIVGAAAAAMVTVIAVTFGSLAAYVGGWLDSVIGTIADVVLTIPSFPLLAVLASLIRLNNPLLLAALIAAVSWPVLLRAVRGQVLSLRERDYVEAARALDLGTPHILFREILPNMRGYIAIYFVLSMTNAIYQQVGLYLLGFAALAGDNWGSC